MKGIQINTDFKFMSLVCGFSYSLSRPFEIDLCPFLATKNILFISRSWTIIIIYFGLLEK